MGFPILDPPQCPCRFLLGSPDPKYVHEFPRPMGSPDLHGRLIREVLIIMDKFPLHEEQLNLKDEFLR
jgi:hypothetical protein